MSADLTDLKNRTRAGMDKAIEALRRDLSRVRTGRASVSILDDVRLDYYGTPTPLNQVGSMTVPEPRLIIIQPWEKKLIPEIERAIQKADLGINPTNDGLVIRLAFPALTEERRKEMVKQVKKMGEEGKVAVRSARRDANESLKKLLKDKAVSEDDEKRGEKEIQELTDDYVARIDKVIADKEKELLEI
ncbi:MAG: ribosome recycling factor [Desulfuromonadales bacterium]